MDTTIFAIVFVAVIWHLSISLLMAYADSRRRRKPLENILRLAELDLLERLKKILDRSLAGGSEEIPSNVRLEEVEDWLRRVRENSE